jgi:hypothetical protein
VHGAGAALRNAAAVLGAHQAKVITQHPKQGRIGSHIHPVLPAVYMKIKNRHGKIFFVEFLRYEKVDGRKKEMDGWGNFFVAKKLN